MPRDGRGEFDLAGCGGLESVRAWLRRVMPRVGAAAIVVFVAWALVRQLGYERAPAISRFFSLAFVVSVPVSRAFVRQYLQAALRAQTTILRERIKLSGRVTVTAAAASGDGVDFELPCGIAGVDTDCAVEQMAASINDQLCRSTDSNRFATVLLALYDDAARRLRYTNAGHNPPLLVRASGRVERLETGGTVIGAFDWARYEEASVALEAGNVLVLFSDGITEAQDRAGDEYGDDRLAAFAVANRHLSTDDLRAAVFDEVDAWTEGQERADDQTIIILKAQK